PVRGNFGVRYVKTEQEATGHYSTGDTTQTVTTLGGTFSQRVPIGREGSENQYLVLVCEVVAFHVRDDIYDDGRIDPRLLHPLGRLGGNAYSHPGEIFEMERPPSTRPH
ncbi:MAG: hypothetical protein JHC83_01480, partial [Thermoleophilia bacterium]|nr:hypothetical protein [Thermoleophilia bacterium]